MKNISAIIISLISLMLGSGLLTVVTPLIMQQAGWPINAISIIATLNFIGLIVGAIHSKGIISKLGYRAAFTLFAIFIAGSTLLQGIAVKFESWSILRFLNGYCFSAIYIIVESWLLALSAHNNRNQILAIYLTSFYAATATGQFILRFVEPWTLQPFVIISLLSIAAILPLYTLKQPVSSVADNRYLSMYKLFKSSQLGLLGCILAGMILGIFYSFAPLLFQQNQISLAADFMGFTILGGMLGQLPIGWLADQFNRIFVFIAVALVTTLLAGLLINHDLYSPLLLNLLGFCFGWGAFTLYPLSMSCAIEELPGEEYIAATSSLILSYNLGSATGPVLANLMIKFCGKGGIFMAEFLIGIMPSLYLIARYELKKNSAY